MSVELRSSDTDPNKRDIPSFIEPRPPLILNPFMRPKPQKGVNLMELFDEDSVSDEPEWVNVYLRLKPCDQPNTFYEVRSDRHFITSVDTATAGHGRRTLHNVSKMYTFSRIFGPETTQKEIFDHIVKDNLKKLPEGHNFTLLTYGASGSGKTYTLMGTVSSPGLVPRSLEYVFKVVDAAQQPLYKPSDNGAEKLNYHQQEYELQAVKRLRNVSSSFRDRYRRASTQVINDMTASTFDLTNRTKYYVWVSFVEIYNEKIYDLLTNSDRSKSSSNLHIREDSNGNVFVKGATQAFVRTGEEAYDIMVAAKYNLQVAATGVHAHSSRSHCIFTITMLTESECSVRSSYVRLCDLAGCERLRQTRNTGARMVESRAINSSLHVLERCLRMLKRKQRHREDATIVPYRESKLTRLLGAGLSGARNEAVTMVVALNPAPHCAHLNRHVLQLATVAKDIQVNSTIAETILESSSQNTTAADDYRYEVMKLREENERLHFELVQAQSCISDLQAAMDAKQQESAKTMYEIVEEAKDITRQYYEAQIQSLRSEMEEMREEYENKLKAVAQNPNVSRFSTEFGTPSKQILQKNKQLETVLALKEEELEDERLARARLEAEVQRLLGCIEERDEERVPSECDEIISDEDSESEDEDPQNQTLEMTVKKKDVNKSVHQSRLNNTTLAEVDESDDEQLEVTYKDVDSVLLHEKTLETSDVKEDTTRNQMRYENFDLDESLQVTLNSDDKTQSAAVRGTYFVRNDDCNNANKENDESLKSTSSSNSNRGTYCVDKVEPKSTASSSILDEAKIKALSGTYLFGKFNGNSSNEELISSNGSDGIFKKPLYSKTMEEKSNVLKNTLSVDECDMSLAQFEQLEKDSKNEVKNNSCDLFKDIKLLKGKRNIFEENSIQKCKDSAESINNVNLLGDDRSPSIVKDEVTNDFEPNKIITILGDSFKRPDIISTVLLTNKVALSKKNESLDLFEAFDSPNVVRFGEEIPEKPISNSENAEKNSDQHIEMEHKVSKSCSDSIEKCDHVLEPKFEGNKYVNNEKNNSKNIKPDIKFDKMASVLTVAIEKPKEIPVLEKRLIFESKNNTSKLNSEINCNKVEEKQSQLKVSKNDEKLFDNTPENNTIVEFENIYKNLTVPNASAFDHLVLDDTNMTVNISSVDNKQEEKELEQSKYNLRHKGNNISLDKKDQIHHEILLESEAKCEVKPTKRNLRLRRRKNATENEKNEESKEISKLKDIVNLQTEFSDVTMDKPAPKKDVADIPSPEKTGEEENVPPAQEMLSCPSKSVTRSRRKLFTPRPEPLEESIGSGESTGRVRVPRPSYHRGRARRKL